MTRDQLKHITTSHYRKIKTNATKMAGDVDAESIHRFRVEYKKLRAFLRMLSQGAMPAGRIKITIDLKKAYGVAGQIRDLQLQQQRVLQAGKEERKKPIPYISLLQLEIDKLRPELVEILSWNPVAASKKKTDSLLPGKFPLNNFRNFARKKKAAIQAILVSGHFSDENIHAIRKILKDLFYNLKEYTPGRNAILPISILKGKEEKYFEKLLNELGTFQDQCTAIALLKTYWINSLNTDTREQLGRLKNEWTKKKLIMKQSLLKKLKA